MGTPMPGNRDDEHVSELWNSIHRDASGQAYLLLDGAGNILRADPEVAALSGLSPEALPGTHLAAALPLVEGGPPLGVVLRSAHETGVAKFSARSPADDAPLSGSCVRLNTTDDPAAALFMVSMRGNAQVQQAAGLSSAPIGLQLTFDQMAVGIVMAGLDGSILMANQAIRDLLGRDFSSDCIHPDDLDATITEVIPCIRGERDGFAMDKRLIHADGSIVWVHENFTMVRDAEGNPLNYFSQYIDITERKRAEQRVLEREAQVKFLSDGLPVALIEVDGDQVIRNGNAVLAELLGADPVGRNIMDVIHEADVPRLSDRNAIDESDTFTGEIRVRRADGEIRWVRSHSRLHRGPTGELRSAIGTWTDITEEVRMRTVSRQFGEVLESIPDVVAVTDPDGRIQYLNQAGRALIGANGQTPAGLQLGDVLADRADATVLATALGAAVRDGWWTGELDLAGAGSTERRVSATVTTHAGPTDDEPFLSVLTRDITALKQAEAALRRQATTDALTGLHNRAGFFDRLAGSLDGRADARSRVGLLFVDLDWFKPVNDRMGHDAGDQLLAQVASRLRATVRGTDTVARLGGDEFVVILEPLQDGAVAEAVGQRILDALAEPFMLDAGVASISASLGLALSDPDSTAQSLLTRADGALYTAKARGRAQLAVAAG